MLTISVRVSVCLSVLFHAIVMGQAANRSSLLESVFHNYDKKLAPKFDKGGMEQQVAVTLNLFINSMSSINEANMEYTMSVFLRERWTDPRLTYTAPPNLTRLELDTSIQHQIWVPDLFIVNEKESHFHDVTVPNRLVHIYPNGTVQISMRVTGSFSCIMHLQKYPFDTQKCKFEVESYGHSVESLMYQWSEGPVTVSEGIEFPQFQLISTDTYNCEKDYYGILYPCIGVEFTLERSYSYYISQVYIPSILVVFLSWVNFWLDCDAVPARISLGLLTVLTMTTQSSGARSGLPRVSYTKAIDVWMAVCLVFVFAALVEFAYVNVHSRVNKRRRTISVKEPSTNSYAVKPEEVEVEMKPKKIPFLGDLAAKDKARAIDKVSRIVFPIIFLLFNIFYWVFYFLWDPDFSE